MVDSNFSDSILQIVLLSLFVSFIVFLILREFWCWYFKINSVLEESKEQTFLLKIVIEELKKNNEILLDGFDLEEDLPLEGSDDKE